MSWPVSQGPATPVLNLSDLYQTRKTRDSSRLAVYNKILAQVHKRIQVVSQLPNTPSSVLYTVPQFIFGVPRIDMEDCISYIMYQLRTGGFEVHFTPPNLLYISWKAYEQRYLLEESPLLGAIAATREAAALSAPLGAGGAGGAAGGKRAGGGGGAQERRKGGDVRATVGLQPPTLAVGSIPQAGAYAPPAAFLQMMRDPLPDRGKSSVDGRVHFS